MKKHYMAFIYISLLMIGAVMNVYKEPLAAGAQQVNEAVVIPEEAIRLRILANSDSEEDQVLKRKIRDEVNKEITVWVEKLTSVEEARELIKSRLPEIEKIVQATLVRENMVQEFTVDFNNVSFPTKMYGSYIYPAGDYEAILITLGEGKGANWWCVLFPPLCFLDFSNGQAVQAAELEEEAAPATEEADASEELASLLADEEETVEKASEEMTSLIVDEEEEKEQVEVKFFLVEWFEGVFS
ncbi:stage II sporulation protein R [Metabacillus indicus]|uniref:Stage II sporulation protein R n=1 Tax=Metabacillus indicus TaxID=246786 RepID=A0A084GP02_METID|nr:stage II sporulation protein R [Metabacillus indicus]KEZ49064.1 stage II sporulation protein R [Metabacillus indicus]